jgi:uncharacterized protein YegL
LVAVAQAQTQCAKFVVVFNIDGSSSESDADFAVIKNFTLSFSSLYNYNISQIAAVQFSSTVITVVGLTSSQSTFDNAITNMAHLNASTKTGAGISRCTDILDSVDDSFAKVIITITDGAAKDDVTDPVNEAENAGITLFAVGLGTLVDAQGLQEIASQPFSTHVYQFNQFNDSLSAVSTILTAVCNSQAVGGSPSPATFTPVSPVSVSPVTVSPVTISPEPISSTVVPPSPSPITATIILPPTIESPPERYYYFLVPVSSAVSVTVNVFFAVFAVVAVMAL